MMAKATVRQPVARRTDDRERLAMPNAAEWALMLVLGLGSLGGHIPPTPEGLHPCQARRSRSSALSSGGTSTARSGACAASRSSDH